MDKKVLFLIIINIVLMLLVYTTRKKRFSNLILLITATFFILTVIEFIYRGFLKEYDTTYAGDYRTGFFKHDSSLGYTIGKTGILKAIRETHAGDTIYDTNYTIINDSGTLQSNINHRMGYHIPNSKKEAVFLGCSVAFGEGLADTQTLAYQFGKLQNVSTLNLGTSGYGTHQVYQLFQQKYAKVGNHHRLFVYSFIPDHVLRANGVHDWNPEGPFFDIQGDSLIYSGIPVKQRQKVNYNLIRYLSLRGAFSFIRDKYLQILINNRVKNLTDTDYERCSLMIRKMAEQIRATGGDFVVLIWDKYDWREGGDINAIHKNRMEKKIDELKNRNVRLVRISALFNPGDPRYFIPKDGHPNALANALIADHLSKYLQP